MVARRHIFLRAPLYDKLMFLSRIGLWLKAIFFYRHVFGSFGWGSIVEKPVLLTNPQFVHIGERVMIRQGARIEAVPCDSTYTPEIRIGDKVNIENFVQIGVIGRLTIGANVSIGSRTAILCGSHPFLDMKDTSKIGDRNAGKSSVIEIGEGAFIGAGVTVLQNVRIGKRAVIGSSSVVKNNIPDYCVAEGNPAKIVMRYDAEQERWLQPEK